jgi:DNA-directed RNA polymerase subunit K/omega
MVMTSIELFNIDKSLRAAVRRIASKLVSITPNTELGVGTTAS